MVKTGKTDNTGKTRCLLPPDRRLAYAVLRAANKSHRSPPFVVLLSALVGGGVALLVSQLNVHVVQPASRSIRPTLDPPSRSATRQSTPGGNSTEIPLAELPQNIQGAPTLVGLRVHNQTAQPIRLVLLSRAQTKQPTRFHWDFAPNEGAKDGLSLSLPQQPLQLQPGDVLMGFSLDGTRQYWGPYVVGTSEGPTLRDDQQEWDLVLSSPKS